MVDPKLSSIERHTEINNKLMDQTVVMKILKDSQSIKR